MYIKISKLMSLSKYVICVKPNLKLLNYLSASSLQQNIQLYEELSDLLVFELLFKNMSL